MSRKNAPSFAEDDFEDNLMDEAGGRGRKQRVNLLVPALLSRWYWVVLGLILGALAALYYLSKVPKHYSATASLIITLPDRGLSGNRAQAEEFDTSTVEGLNTIAARLGRADLLTRVASRPDVLALRELAPPQVDWRPAWWIAWTQGHGPSVGKPPRESQALPPASVAGIIASGLSVGVKPKTRILLVTCKHHSPEAARVFANAVVTEYVAEAEKSLSDNRSSQSSALLRHAEENSRKLAETNSALASYARALSLHQELEILEKLYAQLSLRYRPKYPDMVDARGKLEDIKRRFLEEVAVVMASPVDSEYWKSATSGIESHEKGSDDHLNAVRQVLLARLSVLNAQAKSLETLIQSMSTSRGMGNLERESAETTIRLDDLAGTPDAPSDPNPKKVLTTGSGGGLAVGLLLALLLARLDNKFHSVIDLESGTEMPVMAAIPLIAQKHLQQAIESARKRGKDVALRGPQEHWDPFLLFRSGLTSTNFCETFRVLRASVSLLGDESRRRVTLITSSLPGEGKSFVSANFALAAAAQGRKTLLIDLDLRKPRQHRIFGISRRQSAKPGASQWCARQCSLADATTTETGAENLHIVLSGTRAPNPGELLNTERLAEMLDEARATYDVIVIDSAPLLAVPDTRIIAPVVDNLCLVVRAEWVPKGAVIRSLDLLESANTPLSGLVLNCHNENLRRIGQNYSYGSYRMSKYGKAYQYGYGSYGSYGSYGDDEPDDDEPEDDGGTPPKKGGKRKP